MLELRELLLGAAVPLGVSALLALIGAWRRWAWLMPLAAGAGFLAGYLLISGAAPKLPPRDGTDWLFWCAPVLTLLAVLDGLTRARAGWALAAAAGAVVFLITRPLTPHAVPSHTLWLTAFGAAVLAPALCLTMQAAAARTSPTAVLACLCIVLGGAAVLVIASNLRIVGVYGMSAAAALGPPALLAFRTPAAARAVGVYAVPVLMGILACGYHYPDPGVPLYGVLVLLLAPLLALGAAWLPFKRPLLRAIIALLATAIVTGAVVAPAALAAKQAAEEPAYTY